MSRKGWIRVSELEKDHIFSLFDKGLSITAIIVETKRGQGTLMKLRKQWQAEKAAAQAAIKDAERRQSHIQYWQVPYTPAGENRPRTIREIQLNIEELLGQVIDEFAAIDAELQRQTKE